MNIEWSLESQQIIYGLAHAWSQTSDIKYGIGAPVQGEVVYHWLRLGIRDGIDHASDVSIAAGVRLA